MKFSKNPLVLNSSAPIAPNGSEYNYCYLLILVFAVVCIFIAGIPGIILGAMIGAVAGYVIKDFILDWKCKDLRYDVKFLLYSRIPNNLLVSELTKTLTPLGMKVEVNKNGNPVITHNNVIYDVCYNEDNTFSIWWRKSAVRALFSNSHTKLYRNCVVSMGIIGYQVQQTTKNYAQQSTNI